MSKLKKSILIVVLVLFVDQALKIWIKTNMVIGDEFSVIGKWFLIHFVENNGMAFGFEFGGDYGKIFLSLFRVAAVIGIGWYILKLIKRDFSMGFLTCASLILAGAIGNIIDSAFYGLIFSDSFGHVATLFPPNGGYASFLHGRVVDMFYFPLISGVYPSWMPFVGGADFQFFRPVFNVADSAISVGIFAIIIFYRKEFSKIGEKKTEAIETQAPKNPDIPTQKEQEI